MRIQHLTFIGILTVLYGGVGFANFMLTPNDKYISMATGVDALVPFIPAFVWPYLFYYILMGTPLVFTLPAIELRLLWKRLAWASAVSAIVFLTFPTKTLRFEGLSELSGASAYVLGWIYYIDPPTNCFPSLHVLHSWLIAITYYKFSKVHSAYRPVGILFCLMAAAVSLSTVFIKQHFAVDVLAAFLMIPLILMIVDLDVQKVKREVYHALGIQP